MVPPKEPGGAWRFMAGAVGGGAVREDRVIPRFAKGDRLWVKETVKLISVGPAARLGIAYMADGETPDVQFFDPPERPKALKLTQQTPSIYMPRWASRLTLTVTDVRVERLQAISEADAIAEGLRWRPVLEAWSASDSDSWPTWRSPIRSYAGLWNHINGSGSWNANPWIVAVSFTPELRNIDSPMPRPADGLQRSTSLASARSKQK
jgi:hypothetical protein